MREMKPSADLPIMPFWQARSFWLTAISIVTGIGGMIGVDVAWLAQPGTIDTIMQVVSAASAALAWRERLSPTFQLGLG